MSEKNLMMFNNKLSLSYTYIISGLIFRTIANIFNAVETIYFGLSIISTLLILYGLLIGNKSLNIFKGLHNLFYICLIIVIFSLIIRSYFSEQTIYPWVSFMGALNIHFANPNFILCYLIPILVLNRWEGLNFRLIEKFGYFLSIISLFVFPFLIVKGLSISFFNNERTTGFLGINIFVVSNFFFFLLLFKYLPKKHIIVYFITWFLSFLTTIVFARRGGVALNLILISFVFIVYLMSKKGIRKFKVVLYALILALLLLVLSSLNNTFFDFLTYRGFEDTRSGVNQAVLSQLNQFEQIFGKGVYGRYYFPVEGDMFFNGWRYAVETGFYQMVLRGGYLFAFLYIFVLLIPAIKGIFSSNNIFCKASGLYIIYGLISLFPFGILELNFQFFIYWIIAVLCYSKKIRKMDDAKIKDTFF
jgi:hypothetical protein